ncbi:hypothetical protein tinsulaeT_11720 [Thalassotalea insulae]|uniref:RDD domain-containing protein n=1 Tax=Thalassotalea insulae TaxID=2056778 RepID=A0ABQ6GPH6_9GAMM|nr:RDD family protein [Thalassotalea insulae]GLX77832.1 hypothetical protein tinsulaeT_11720 [Thalassotalea insulae]
MVEHKYKTFWPRFWAGLIDGIIFMPMTSFSHWLFSLELNGVINFIYYALIYSLSYYFYTVYMHGKFGQTIGKMLLKIKVSKIDGSPLTYERALYRDSVVIGASILIIFTEAGPILNGINPFLATEVSQTFQVLVWIQFAWFMIEFITMLTNNKRRAVHDFIAGSVVTRL